MVLRTVPYRGTVRPDHPDHPDYCKTDHHAGPSRTVPDHHAPRALP